MGWDLEIGIAWFKDKWRDVCVGGCAAYPDAALRPSPRLPPVTTATLPSREKMFSKSSSWTSCLALPIVAKVLYWEVGIEGCGGMLTGEGMDMGCQRADLHDKREGMR